ncbi:hypothetical protein CTI14_29740, partial [Methylobacterium radiotolerans]
MDIQRHGRRRLRRCAAARGRRLRLHVSRFRRARERPERHRGGFPLRRRRRAQTAARHHRNRRGAPRDPAARGGIRPRPSDHLRAAGAQGPGFPSWFGRADAMVINILDLDVYRFG